MTIRVKFTEQDLMRVHLIIFFRRVFIRILFSTIGLLFLLTLLLGLLYDRSLAVESLVYVVPVAILIGLQLILAQSRFAADQRYKQPVDYRLEEEGLVISGSNFEILLSWIAIRKVIATKNWILIRQKWKITAAIPKAAFWENEIDELKQTLEKNGVKNNL